MNKWKIYWSAIHPDDKLQFLKSWFKLLLNTTDILKSKTVTQKMPTKPSNYDYLWLLTYAHPLDIVSSPVSILNVVVLPAPLTPSSPKHWPLGTPTQSLSTAVRVPFPPRALYTWTWIATFWQRTDNNQWQSRNQTGYKELYLWGRTDGWMDK